MNNYKVQVSFLLLQGSVDIVYYLNVLAQISYYVYVLHCCHLMDSLW